MHTNARTHARARTRTRIRRHYICTRPVAVSQRVEPCVCLVCLFAPHVRVGERRRAQRCPRRRRRLSCARSCKRTRIVVYKHTPLRAALRRPAAHAALSSAADGVESSHGVQSATIRRDACLPRYSRRAVRVCSAPVYLFIARGADGPAPWRARPAGARAPTCAHVRAVHLAGWGHTHTYIYTHGGCNHKDVSISINFCMSICLCI
jgi:hypothetical protein